MADYEQSTADAGSVVVRQQLLDVVEDAIAGLRRISAELEVFSKTPANQTLDKSLVEVRCLVEEVEDVHFRLIRALTPVRQKEARRAP